MLDLSKCPLYKMSSKRGLKYVLHINDNRWFRQKYVSQFITPYIDKSKNRLIEVPDERLKAIQRNIKNCLNAIVVPDNVFSGVKNRSYIENVRMHTKDSSCNLFKIDFCAFFPSISRNQVYSFFHNDLLCSPDIAAILTNFTTINLEYLKKSLPEINTFLLSKGISEKSHLLSGSPASQILSYLVNHNMFDEMQSIADKNHMIMSIYVDDVFFSSEYQISNAIRKSILHIVQKYNYRVSKNKVGQFYKNNYKKVTGVVIDPNGQMIPCNKIRQDIVNELRILKTDPTNEVSKLRLRGLLIAARQVDSTLFPSIYKFAFTRL